MSKISNLEFTAEVIEICKKIPVSEILDVPGIWEIVSEYFNNEAIKNWEEKNYDSERR